MGRLKNDPNPTFLDLSFRKINDQDIEALVQVLGDLGNIKCLFLNGNDIGCDGARALAQSQVLQGLELLELRGNNIGFEGINALVGSETFHKTFIDLSTDSISGEVVEALAQSQYSRYQTPQAGEPNRNFAINDICDKFYNLLIEAYFENQSIDLDEDSVKKIIFDVRTIDNNGILVKYILEQSDKYPFLINLQKDEEGYGLPHFYHSPEIQEFLFKHGLIPGKEQEEQDNALEKVANGNQSTHEKVAVNQTNFITNKLAEDVKANEDELKQAATSYMESAPQLLEQYQNNQVKVRLLSLTENEKKSVMNKTLPKNEVPDDEEFIKIVSEKVYKILKKEYLKEDQKGKYTKEMSRAKLQYDYTEDGEKFITIPESIGYIKLLIDRFSIPLKERKELLVTLANQNPELVQQNLPKIKLELGNNNVSQEQMTDRAKFYELLNNVADEEVNKLFEEISGFTIEETWREQKEFVLLKQIYVAATTYGENSNACTQGTWSQIINSVSEIDLEMINQYTQYLDREKDQERQRDGITKENVIPFVEDLAGQLIQYVQDNPGLKDALDDFALAIVDIENPEKITLKHQKILATINQEFAKNIKKFLPNYSRNIPKQDEYKIIIEKLPEVGVMQNFVQKENNDQLQTLIHGYITSSDNEHEKDKQEKSSNTEGACVTNAINNRVQGNSKQPNYPDENNPGPQNVRSKLPVIAASTLAIAGVVSGIAIAVYLEMLAVGIAVGACCLVAAAIICCCSGHSNSLEKSSAEAVGSVEKVVDPICLS